MSAIPTVASLADIVTGITETMFGISFALQKQPSVSDAPPWVDLPPRQTAVISIAGPQNLMVAVAADDADAVHLACAMFAVEAGEVDSSMRDDTLSELANIVGGQIKAIVGDKHVLGLPTVMSSSQLAVLAWKGATLVSQNSSLSVWLAVTDSPAQSAAKVETGMEVAR